MSKLALEAPGFLDRLLPDKRCNKGLLVSLGFRELSGLLALPESAGSAALALVGFPKAQMAFRVKEVFRE